MNKNNIYKPKIGNINNNQKVYYSYLEDKLSAKSNDDRGLNADDFLNKLSNSGSYMFTKDVVIETLDNTYNTKIAGKLGNKIVTLDNQVIDMEDIKRIYEK